MESSDGVFEDVGSRRSVERTEKAGTGDGNIGDGYRHNRHGDEKDGARTATEATRVRDSFKGTADDAGLNEDDNGVPKSEKVHRTGHIEGPLADEDDNEEASFKRKQYFFDIPDRNRCIWQ